MHKNKKHNYRSSFEDLVIHDLNKRAVDFAYEPHYLTYRRVDGRYIPDILLANGIYVELKGYFSSSDRSKMLAVRESNPDIDLRIVFQRPSNKLSSTSKTTYGDWATKYGFIWAETQIPTQWLLEKGNKI